MNYYYLCTLKKLEKINNNKKKKPTTAYEGNLEEDNFSLSEMKPNDRVRRDEIIETLNELGVINMRQAQQIFNSRMPTNPRFYLGSPKSKGFILVNNHLGFPPSMDLSPCFIDYLNFRCHSGEILSRLLSRRGKYHLEIFM